VKLTGARIAIALLLLDAIFLFAFWADPPFTDELVGQAGLVRFFLALPAALLVIPLVLWRTSALLRQLTANTEASRQGRIQLELWFLLVSGLLAAVVFWG